MDRDSPRPGWLRYDQDESLEVLFFPPQFGEEWISEGADSKLVLVSETVEVRDQPDGAIIQRMRGELDEIQPEQAVVRYENGENRYEYLLRHAARRYAWKVRYDIPSYGVLAIIEIRDNWARVSW